MAIALLSARATSNRSVWVILSSAPRDGSPIDPTSASNPNLWNVTDLDSGNTLPVFASDFVGLTPEGYGVEVWLGKPYKSPVTPYRLTVSTALVASDGSAFSGGNTLDFSASYWVKQAVVSQDPADLSNPITRGELVVGTSGDYENVSGNELIRKMIVRRLTTPRGAFAHLPDYGLGVSEKDFYTPSDLVTLQAEVVSQVEREPEVLSATARVSLSTDGVLTIQVLAILRISNTALEIEVVRNPNEAP